MGEASRLPSLELPTNELRTGAQCMRMKCSEPAINAPNPIKRQLNFMEPYLRASCVQIDCDDEGIPRWLSSALVHPGLLASYVADEGEGEFRRVTNRGIEKLMKVHKPELVFLFEHEHCAARHMDWLGQHGQELSTADESVLIAETLNGMERLLEEFLEPMCGPHKPTIIKAVCIVDRTQIAARRRSPGIVTLDEYLVMSGTDVPVPRVERPAPRP